MTEHHLLGRYAGLASSATWPATTAPMTQPYNGATGRALYPERTAMTTSGSIVPVTVLHHNDSHGNLPRAPLSGYTQLATLIKQETPSQSDRTLLLSAGDNIQGDAMMYYFKIGRPGLCRRRHAACADLTTHPMMAAMNAMGYDAMTSATTSSTSAATFSPALWQANSPSWRPMSPMTGPYGLALSAGEVCPISRRPSAGEHQGRHPGHRQPPRAEL